MSKATLVSDLSTYQATLAEKQTELQNVNTVIGQKQTALAAQPEIGVLVQQLQTARQQLEMNESLGEEVQASEYEDIDTQIAAAQEDDADTQKLIQLLSDLNQKKQDLLREIESAKTKIEGINTAYVEAELEDVASTYMTHAAALVTEFRKLQGLSFIHNQRRGAKDPKASGSEHQFLSIPVFRLDACGQSSNTPSWPIYENAHFVKHQFTTCVKEDVAAAITTLAAVGINVQV